MKYSTGYYALPANLDQDIEEHAGDVERYLAGELTADLLKAKRVPRGIYEQRQDGKFMVRVRVAGGTLSSPQGRELAYLADEYGNGLLHATTRQDIQLHDVDIADTPAIMRRLKTVGLTSKGGGGNTVRNVAACPYAGICPCECFDVTPFAHAVTEYLIARKDSYTLPRKYKIAFSGCSADCALARINDLGFIAGIRDGKLGFQVYAGGGMGARSRPADRLDDWVPAGDAIRVAETIRRLFDRMGDRHNRHKARLRYVFERIGADAFREIYIDERRAVVVDGVEECSVSEEAVVNPEPLAGACLDHTEKVGSGMRVFSQRQEGYRAVPLHLPLGFIDSSDFAELAAIAKEFSREEGIRTNRFQNLLLRFIPEARLEELEAALRALRTSVIDVDPLENFVACAGASTCRLGLCQSRPVARACAEAIAARNIDLHKLKSPLFNISGCPNACGQHPAAAIGFFGGARRVDERLVPAYRVVLGAHNAPEGFRLGTTVGTVPARALPDLITDMLQEFAVGRQKDEAFLDYFDRVGVDEFRQIIGRHGAIPPYEEAPQFYRDWGQTCDFSIGGRGKGECGAGVFELVQEDIRKAKEMLRTCDDEDGERLFRTLVTVSKALLVTRGEETRIATTVFEKFEIHFIDSGLVDSAYRQLLTLAHKYAGGDETALCGKRQEILDLLARIELLYSTMDGQFRFHPPGGTAVSSREIWSGTTSTEQEELDLTGVECPLNFVKAKLKLDEMGIGDILSIILDDGEPIRRVPASFAEDGQKVLETRDLGDGRWRLLVRREK